MNNEDRSTTAQLRDDIDSGKTGSKVAASDPAASPLGTDDEAAGTSPTAERVAMAREAEKKIGDAAARERSKGSRRGGSATIEGAEAQRGSNSPYAKEEYMNEELARQRLSEKVEADPSEQPS